MKITPTIIVEVNPEYFIFTNGDTQLRLWTSINYILENNAFTPVAVGEEKDIPDTIRVNLFSTEEKNTLEKMPSLQLFLEYGIGKMFEKKFSPQLRPLIIFKQSEKLSGILCGYQIWLLESVALLAGARDVKFE